MSDGTVTLSPIEKPQPNGSTGLGKKGSIVTAALPAIAAADKWQTQAIIGTIVIMVIASYTFLEWSKNKKAPA